MAASTFHHFPLLPCELRLEIWKFAIRPSRGGGLHSFTILTGQEGDTTLVETIDLSTNRRYFVAGIPGTGNRSAYLWDCGLWTACWESREVMLAHFKVRLWDERRISVDTEREREMMKGVLMIDVPVIVTAPHNGADWHLMVRPYRDLFHLTAVDWKWEMDWDTIFFHLPFSWRHGYYYDVRNIAIDFDPSWNDDLPDHLYKLLQEPTARGFVARAVEAYARGEMNCSIWLIDRSASLEAPTLHEPVLFYDCDEEYVEAEPRGDLLCSRDAASFIHELAHVGGDDYAQMEELTVLSESELEPYDVGQCVRILTPRRQGLGDGR